MKLTVRVWRDGRRETRDVAPDEVSDLLLDPHCVVWLDVFDADETAVGLLRTEFGFHELALEDVHHAHQRPKIEPFDGYAFLVAYAIGLRDGELDRREIQAFVARHYLVTVHRHEIDELETVAKRWDAHSELLPEGGGYLLYILLDSIVDAYFGVLDHLEDVADDVEEGLESTALQTDIFHLRRELAALRRVVSPLRDVIDLLQQRTLDVVTEPLYPYYRDVYDHVLRVIDFVETLRDVLGSALEVQLTIASNRLNEVMRSVTSWGAIILVPTLIAGVYGMNFRHMPELGWLFGYPFALALMVVAAFGLYKVFKRRGWL